MQQELVDRIAVEIPEAPLVTLREALRWSARQFCTEADAWIVSDEPVVVAANMRFPEIEAPAGAEPLRIIELLDGDRRLAPGRDYYQHGPTRIEFLSTPAGSILYGTLAVRPSSANWPPDEVLSRWAEGICHGALYRLLMMPQPWHNTTLAQYYRREMAAAQAEARQSRALGHQSGGARVRMRPLI